MQRNEQKKCAARANLLFYWLDLLLFFHRSRCLRCLVLHDFMFYVLFEQTINIIDSFAFSRGKIYILVLTDVHDLNACLPLAHIRVT